MPQIRYEFIAAGQEGVRGAIRGITDETRTADKTADEIFRRGRARQRETARDAARGADHTRKLAEQVAKDQEKAARHVAGIKERYFREEHRKEEQAERKKERDAAQAEARRQRALAQGISARRREVSKEIGDRQKHEDRLASVTQKAADKRAENERRHQRTLADIRRTSDKRIADIGARAKDAVASRESARSFDRELRQKQFAYDLDKRRKQLRDKERDDLKAEIGGTLKGVLIGGAVTAGALGLGVTGAAARDAVRLQELSNRISISARGAGEDAVDPNALRREFQQTAIRTPGVRSVDIAEAVAQFVSKTGNLDVARKSQGVFATVASATGSQVQDVAAAAADLFQKFDINTVEGMADAMAALAFQGKAGAFELKDAASQFAKLSAAGQRFGIGKGAEGVRVLGGLTQIARGNVGSPEQAATAMESLFRQFTSREAGKQLKAIGVNPFRDKAGTQTKDVRDLIVETITKSGGSLTKLQGIFGDEGIRAVSSVISAFNEAEAKQKGTGAAAARTVIDTAINAPGDFSELQKDAAQAQQDASAKLAATWEKLSAGLGDKLLPIITQVAEKFADSPDSIDAFVGTVEVLALTFEGLMISARELAESLGIAANKTKSPEKIQAEKLEEAKRIETQINQIGSMQQVADLRAQGKTKEANAMEARLKNPGALERVQTLQAKREVLLQQAGAVGNEVTTIRDQQKRVRGFDEFAREYAAMAAPGSDRAANEKRAREVGQQLRDEVFSNEDLRGNQAIFEGETEKQRQFRANQAMARQETLGNMGVKAQSGEQADIAGKGGSALEQAAAKLAAAAAKLEGAAAKTGTPTILGPG